jgi:hypothetical protein
VHHLPRHADIDRLTRERDSARRSAAQAWAEVERLRSAIEAIVLRPAEAQNQPEEGTT